MAGGELGLETWLPPMAPHLIVDEVGMSLVCIILRLSLRKGRYANQLQWESMRKGPTALANLYMSRYLGMNGTIYSRYVRILTAMACTKRGTWFGTFMRGSNIRMGVINNQDFRITCNMDNDVLGIWEEEWKGLNKRSGKQR